MPTPLTPKAQPTLAPLSEAVRILFKDARDRIADPLYWLQGELARTRGGTYATSCSPNSKAACCWCGIGSVLRTLNSDSLNTDILARSMVARLNQMTAILLDDDRRTFAQVNDGKIAEAELPEQLRPLTPHQRVLFIFDEVLKT